MQRNIFHFITLLKINLFSYKFFLNKIYLKKRNLNTFFEIYSSDTLPKQRGADAGEIVWALSLPK